jgi:aralkylamine N-acetyltransferase
MNLEITTTTDGIDWNELCSVFERAPLGTREPEKLRRAFERSYRVCFAHDAGRLVGAARLLSDGEYYAAVYDVVVAPEYQRHGVGSAMLQRLMSDLDVGSFILVSATGKEAFYRQHGYSRLLTGMARYRDPERARTGGYID